MRYARAYFMRTLTKQIKTELIYILIWIYLNLLI